MKSNIEDTESITDCWNMIASSTGRDDITKNLTRK